MHIWHRQAGLKLKFKVKTCSSMSYMHYGTMWNISCNFSKIAWNISYFSILMSISLSESVSGCIYINIAFWLQSNIHSLLCSDVVPSYNCFLHYPKYINCTENLLVSEFMYIWICDRCGQFVCWLYDNQHVLDWSHHPFLGDPHISFAKYRFTSDDTSYFH